MGRLSTLVVLLAACGRMGFDDISEPDEPPPPDGTVRVTVEYKGVAGGTVVGPNGFTCVGQTCTLDVDPGTPVTLRGLAATDTWFAGWTGPCGGNFDCELQVDADMTVLADFSPTPNRVFITSTTTDGAFGGVAGADAICGARATAGGLNGTFVAFVSDGATNASTRVNTSRGWVRVDGAPYADAPTAFADGAIIFPPRTDEYGNDLGAVRVFTGTNAGNVTANRCLEWTTNSGAENATMNQTEYGYDSIGGSTSACSEVGHLMCVEIGRAVPITPKPDYGRLAFMSKTEWTPGGGRASADAHCAGEASSAGLSGTFLAALATTTESIASRFPVDAVYRRSDDVRLLRGPGLFAGDWLDVSPELDQFGAAISSDFWTGALRLNVVAASGNDNCNDWNDSTAGLSGIQHWTTNTDLRDPAKNDGCDGAFTIMCVEK